MAAYGALVTLTNLMEPIRHYQAARYPVFSDNQLMQLESLEQKALFLQKFLETYSSGRRSDAVYEALEDQIADAVYFAQDFIENRIADVIRTHFRGVLADAKSDVSAKFDVDAGYDALCALFEPEYAESIAEDNIMESHITDEIRSLCVTAWKTHSDDLFSQALQKVIQILDLIQSDASNIAENAYSLQKDKQPGDSVSVGLHKPPTADQFKDPSVTFGDALDQMMNKLLNRKQVELQTIPVTGMGGIGKTTLAQTVYHNPRIAQHFDVRGWVAISQEFSPRGILFGLLTEMKVVTTTDSDSKDDYHKLGDKLHKHLYGRRYLIILDDVWDVEAWDKVKRFLPDNNQGSRIVVTTRLSTLADSISSSKQFEMSLLDDDESWSLLKRKVFSTSESSCSPELEEIGKRIAKSCKGLPLSIALMGGLLAKSVDREYWKSVEEDVNAGVNSEVSDHCLKILGTSYHHMPIHLKPCFLYFGVYPEDHEIKVSELINLWVAEGFLKPKDGESLEEVAYEYLEDLANRNLIIVSKWKFSRKMKVCKIHDLLRDLCLREDKKKRFRAGSYCSQNKIYINSSTGAQQNYSAECSYALPSSSLVRSLEVDDDYSSSNLKLLRIWKLCSETFSHRIFDTINVRYLHVYHMQHSLVSMADLLWNLHTLITRKENVVPCEIWDMPRLRHLESWDGFTIRDPCGTKAGREHNIGLKNLHTIEWVKNFRCSEEIAGKIQNLKKLKVQYDEKEKVSAEHVRNLGRLTKLDSLSYVCYFPDCCLAFESKLKLSVSITKLEFYVGYFNWEEMGKHIGSLPNLQWLELRYDNGGEEWNLIEGEFPSLRYMCIRDSNLVRWTTDGGSVLPCLEHLVLFVMKRMEGIPLEIGDIPTLQSIRLYGLGESYSCSKSVVESGREILKDQQQLGNLDLHLHISRYFIGGHKYEIKDMLMDRFRIEEEEIDKWLMNNVEDEEAEEVEVYKEEEEE